MSTKISPTSFLRFTLTIKTPHSLGCLITKSVLSLYKKPLTCAPKLKKMPLLKNLKKRNGSVLSDNSKKLFLERGTSTQIMTKSTKVWAEVITGGKKTCESLLTNLTLRDTPIKVKAKVKTNNLWLRSGWLVKRKKSHTKTTSRKINRKLETKKGLRPNWKNKINKKILLDLVVLKSTSSMKKNLSSESQSSSPNRWNKILEALRGWNG